MLSGHQKNHHRKILQKKVCLSIFQHILINFIHILSSVFSPMELGFLLKFPAFQNLLSSQYPNLSFTAICPHCHRGVSHAGVKYQDLCCFVAVLWFVKRLSKHRKQLGRWPVSSPPSHEGLEYLRTFPNAG